MKYIYIAGPYTHPDPVENTNKAIKVAEQLIKKEFVPIIPHLTLLWHVVSPHPEDFWYNYTLEQMKVCDAVLRIEGMSKGADNEVRVAKEIGMKVFYSIDDLNDA